MIFNIYSDESCHLENDDIDVMVLGCIWCPQTKLKDINQRIRDIKKRNSISEVLELKWTKVSPAKLEVYLDLLNYFFDDDDLHFRGILIQDKRKLNHQSFNQTHDLWYYKMYFEMLKVILSPEHNYEIYIDIKDTNSYLRAQKLKEVCSNSMYDFSQSIITRIQPIRSEEVQLMQIVDILIGAIAYLNRTFPENHIRSEAKLRIIDLIKRRSKYSLKKTTLYREEKLNLLVWSAREC